jgi:hypothetical protein
VRRGDRGPGRGLDDVSQVEGHAQRQAAYAHVLQRVSTGFTAVSFRNVPIHATCPVSCCLNYRPTAHLHVDTACAQLFSLLSLLYMCGNNASRNAFAWHHSISDPQYGIHLWSLVPAHVA